MKFADTSFLVALLNPKDQWHALAKTAATELNEPVLTSMWVVVELGDALCVGENRALFLRFLDRLAGQSQWETVSASPEWFRRGVELFQARGDKEWSLTDCISFAVMKEHGISDALTHDHHFEQAGFRVSLRSANEG